MSKVCVCVYPIQNRFRLIFVALRLTPIHAYTDNVSRGHIGMITFTVLNSVSTSTFDWQIRDAKRRLTITYYGYFYYKMLIYVARSFWQKVAVCEREAMRLLDICCCYALRYVEAVVVKIVVTCRRCCCSCYCSNGAIAKKKKKAERCKSLWLVSCWATIWRDTGSEQWFRRRHTDDD